MFNQSNWLELQDELYPNTLVTKILNVQEYPAGGPLEFPVQLVYNSLHREIDFTDALISLITQFFSFTRCYRVQTFDAEESKVKIIGQYPFKQLVILKGQLIESEIIYLQVDEVDDNGNLVKEKKKRVEKTEKTTLKDILKLVGKWRKMYSDNKKKMTLEESANILGVPKSTLDDYYVQIKLAQKYNFNFETHYQMPFSCIRKFVKENHEKIDKNFGSVLGMLEKYHPN